MDIAALIDLLGIEDSASTLIRMDEYYSDLDQREEAVSTPLMRQLADPRPRDEKVTRELASYKGLAAKWHEWDAVTGVLRNLAQAMLR